MQNCLYNWFLEVQLGPIGSPDFLRMYGCRMSEKIRRVPKITTIKKAFCILVLILDVERNVSKTLLNNVLKKSVPSCSFAKNRISLGGERRHGQRAAHGRRRERGGRLPGRQGALPHQELERPRFAPRANPDTLAV